MKNGALGSVRLARMRSPSPEDVWEARTDPNRLVRVAAKASGGGETTIHFQPLTFRGAERRASLAEFRRLYRLHAFMVTAR